MAYNSSYNNGLYRAKEKYILDLSGAPITSVTLTVSGQWVNYKTQNFKNIESLAIEGAATSV
jgi:phage antirepressor YoqD-like protein